MANDGPTPTNQAGESELTRRDFVRGAAVAGIVVGGTGYVKPMLKLMGVTRLAAATSTPPVTIPPPPVVTTTTHHGCTLAFWRTAAGGASWWDQAVDPAWASNGGHGTNPFTRATLFNSFFTPHPHLAGLTMWQVANGAGSDAARGAARQLIAAYLDASFGHYPHTTTQLRVMWTAAVTGGNAALRTLAELLRDLNLECDAREA